MLKEKKEEKVGGGDEAGCKALEDHPNVMPGWGCCRCRTYNGKQRDCCKNCGHVRCGGTAGEPRTKGFDA